MFRDTDRGTWTEARVWTDGKGQKHSDRNIGNIGTGTESGTMIEEL